MSEELDDLTSKLLSWLQRSQTESAFDTVYQCLTRDVFQAKLDNLYQYTKNSLLIAVAGEIGNNAFDHNLGNWRDITGIYFRHFPTERLLAIADRGQGIRQTLKRIMPDIKSDKEAVEIAFTKLISGRSPEQRGNGLKFVASVVKQNNWGLDFYSGTGSVRIKEGKMTFTEEAKIVYGCLAFLKY